MGGGRHDGGWGLNANTLKLLFQDPIRGIESVSRFSSELESRPRVFFGKNSKRFITCMIKNQKTKDLSAALEDLNREHLPVPGSSSKHDKTFEASLPGSGSREMTESCFSSDPDPEDWWQICTLNWKVWAAYMPILAFDGSERRRVRDCGRRARNPGAARQFPLLPNSK